LARRVGIGVGAVVLLASMAAGGGQARAVSGVQSGNWTVAQTAGGQLPAPPNVPAGGMWVSSNTATVLAVAAVRLTLDTGEAPPVIISLQIDKESPPGGAAIYACPTTGEWQPQENGPSGSAPPYDCSSKHVVGIHSSDGTRLVFDVTDLATSSGLDIALVPQPATNALPAAVPPPPSSPPPAPVPVPTTLPGLPLPPTPVTLPVTPPSTIPTQPNASFDATFQPFTADQVQVLGSTPPTSAPSFDISGGSNFSFTTPDLQAPLPLGSTTSPFVPTTTVRKPQVAGPTVRRPAPAAKTKGLSGRNRAMLGGTLAALLAWEFRDGVSGAGGLPPLTLYDAPDAVRAARTPPREGKPPPVR
jgi:hypothetical protein